MSISGPDGLRAIEEALRDVRREEDDVLRRLARGIEVAARLRKQEGALLLQLAATRLEANAQAAFAASIIAGEDRLGALLEAHSDALAAGEVTLGTLDNAIAQASDRRAALQIEAQKRNAELAALAERLGPELDATAPLAAKRADAAALAAIATASRRKAAQAEADREQKGRPYRDDPLFMYLWGRGYGTTGYRANLLVSALDAQVAALIGFAKARGNFSISNDIPLRLRDHAKRQQALAETAAGDVAAIERAALDRAGGKGAREAMDQTVAGIDALDTDILARQDERDMALTTQRRMAEGSEPAFAAALAGLNGALAAADLRVLPPEERGSDDATLLPQVDELRQRARDEDAETRDQKARLRTLVARRRDLEDIQHEFKNLGFDNPLSRFADDDLVVGGLNAFLRGTISATSYWMQWRRSQEWSVPERHAELAESRLDAASTTNGAWGLTGWLDDSASGAKAPSGYGGPAGGWGRIAGRHAEGDAMFSRPRGDADQNARSDS